MEEKPQSKRSNTDNGEYQMTIKEMSWKLVREAVWEIKTADETDVATELIKD